MVSFGLVQLSDDRLQLHRDFLDPLLPVYALEYIAIAPHNMKLDELEIAHRDILSAFDYSLGVAPQLVMDELWFGLPALRELLDFDEGWTYAMDDAWLILFDAVCGKLLSSLKPGFCLRYS